MFRVNESLGSPQLFMTKSVFHNQQPMAIESSKFNFSCFGLLLDPLIGYSQVPNRRISLIREYHEYFLIVVNEYHVINEYIGKSHDIHKRI